MLEKLGKFKLLIVGVLVSFLFIAITIGQLQKRQEIRSRAAGEAVSVVLNPLIKSVNVGDTLNVAVTINGGQNNVSAADITFSYDANLLGNPNFQPATTFTTIVNDTSTPGTIHFVGVNPTSNAITGSSISLGSLSFVAKAQGTATVGFSNIHINASGVAGALPVDTTNTKTGTYTITTSNMSPSPTQAITTPTLTKIPTVTPTVPSGQTQIALSLLVTGIGTDVSKGQNANPKNAQRAADVKVFNSQNQEIASIKGSVVYNPQNGNYEGRISLGGNVPSGSYTVKVRLDNTLWKTIPGIQVLTIGAVTQTPTTALVSGDINQDNEINLLDYTLLLTCIQNPNSCSNTPLSKEDVNSFVYAIKNRILIRNGD